jgi:hypothetical protein
MVTSLGIPQAHPILQIVKPITCKGKDHAEQYFQQVCQSQATDGIVLRDPSAWYYKKDSFFCKKVIISEFKLTFVALCRRAAVESGQWKIQMVCLYFSQLTLQGHQERSRHFNFQKLAVNSIMYVSRLMTLNKHNLYLQCQLKKISFTISFTIM